MKSTNRKRFASTCLSFVSRSQNALVYSPFSFLKCWWLTMFLLMSMFGGNYTFGWSAQHKGAAWLGATISPEPFKSNADLCSRFALYPDQMNDWWIGHGRDDIDRIIFTFEAIDALRINDIPKALFFASAATHYPTDRACIAHSSDLWKISQKRTPWIYAFLPKRYQSFSMPGEVKTATMAGLATPTRTFFAPAIPAPPFRTDLWTSNAGDPHTWGDALPDLRRDIDLRTLVKPTGWTYHDFCIYANWYAGMLTLELFDPQSIETGPPKWRSATEIKTILLEELRNGAMLDCAYFSYLVTAANTVIQPPLAKVIPEYQYDKLLKLAETHGAVIVDQNASWPMKRAAHLLAYELYQAKARWAKLNGLGPPKPHENINSFVLHTTANGLSGKLADRSAIVLLSPDNKDLAKAVKAPEIPAGKSGVISTRQAEGGRIHIILHGATQQNTLYLVDYLLDLVYARHITAQPGRWPTDRVMSVYQQFWPGWSLVNDLKKMSGEDAVLYAERLPYKAALTVKPIVDEAFKDAGVFNDSPLPSPREFLLLSLPLPDGRTKADFIDKWKYMSQERVRK